MRKGVGQASGLARVLGVVALVVGFAGSANAGEFKQGEVIVKYKDGVARSRTEMNALYNSAGVKSVKRFGGTMKGIDHVVLADDIKVQDAIAAFEKSSVVEFAQPNYILRALPIAAAPRVNNDDDDGGTIPCIPGFDIPGCDDGGGGGGGSIPCLIPGIPFPPGCEDGGGGDNPFPNPGNPSQPPANRPELAPAPADVNPPVADPQLEKAYGLAKIGAVDAWKDHRGSKDFVVAVIDTGVDYNHEDLAFNMWRKKDEQTGKEFVGYDFIHNDNLPFDDQGHGTHTSGTVGAVGANGKGVSGVAQRVSIMGLKFLSAEGSGTTADAIRAIDYAITNGAKVLSNSWGGKGDDNNKALKEAIERARAKDVLFIAAAGNDGTDNDGRDPSYPAAFDNDNLISVAATDSKDAIAFFSNYGKKTTHLAAPGVNIYSTIPGNKYKQESGTSMACPHVAGAAALLWSQHPSWNYKKVKEVLMNTTDKLSALDGKTVTGGHLNILKALRSTE